jgi:hypothetical protein
MEPITIDLGDKRFELKPTYKAAQTISKNYGGLMGALQRLGRLELEVVHDVVCAGLGPEVVSTAKQRDEIGEMIYAAGLTDDTAGIAEKCVRYVMLLMRGGRPPKAGEDK